MSRFSLDNKTAVAAVHKRVLVAGGGPTGLEAARTAALRGRRRPAAGVRSRLIRCATARARWVN